MDTLTNKPNQGSSLAFPEDFRAACLLSGLSHERVLQHFIDQMSICNAFTCGKNVYKAFPAEVIYEYATSCGKTVLAVQNRVNRLLSMSYLRQLLGISRATGLDRKSKRSACHAVITSWYRDLCPRIVSSETLRVNRGIHLTCSTDFMLLCALFEVQPVDILQYFINQISLPWIKAQIKPSAPGTGNPALSFFIAMSAGKTGIYKDDPNTDETEPGDIYFHFIGQMQELDLRLLFTRDQAERERAYRKLYRAWYKALLRAK